jgi:hypothetical protein
MKLRGLVLFSAVVSAVTVLGCNKNGLVDGTPTPVPTTPTPVPSSTPEYLGKEFFAADLDNINDPSADAAAAQFSVAVSNPDAATTANVVINNKAGQVTTAAIAPGSLQIFDLPRADIDGTVFNSKAYQIVSDIPVTAHQFNPLGNVLVYSNDASMLLPTSALSNDYRAMAWQETGPAFNTDQLPGFMTIVAVEDGTTNVTVTMAGKTRASADGTIAAMNAGQTYTKAMQKFDVLSFETRNTPDDITGSKITSDKKIAVFGGAECAYVPSNVTACDHLEEQVYPTNVWGKIYVAAKSQPRGTEPDVWRVMAKIDNTTVTTDPLQPGTPVTLMAGQFVDITTASSFVIQAGAAVLVGQFLVGQDYGLGGPTGSTGDPSMIMGVPVEQYRKDYIFLTPPNYAHDGLTIMAPSNANVTVDGTPVAAAAWTAIGTSGWRVGHLTMNDGVHHVGSDQPVGLEVTGYDMYVSYGYIGGMNLVTLPDN